MRFLVVIPARRASTRLADKPLQDIGGMPMVVRTAMQARKSGADRVIVATDDTAIEQAVRQHGFDVVLTSPDHPTGTDRMAEVVRTLDLEPDSVVVNVQGDEPLIDPAIIDSVAQRLVDTPNAAIATCACPIADAETLFNPNAVKVVCDVNGRALYFSRAPIPWARDALAGQERLLAEGLPALHHIGLYALRTRFLLQFPSLAVGPLEKFEALEQLRAMENGFSIVVQKVAALPAPGVDTREDLERVRKIVAKRS